MLFMNNPNDQTLSMPGGIVEKDKAQLNENTGGTRSEQKTPDS